MEFSDRKKSTAPTFLGTIAWLNYTLNEVGNTTVPIALIRVIFNFRLLGETIHSGISISETKEFTHPISNVACFTRQFLRSIQRLSRPFLAISISKPKALIAFFELDSGGREESSADWKIILL